MPVIKNKYYLSFIENKVIAEYLEVSTEQFEEWLNEINEKVIPRKCTVSQARALFILLYHTGRRPSELVTLRSNHIEKITKKFRHFLLTIEALKGGKTRPIPLPFNKYTLEVYDYMKKYPPSMNCFNAFLKHTRNRVKVPPKEITVRTIQADGTMTEKKELTEREPITYYRKGETLGKYCLKWTGRPAYWFRHYRYTSMAKEGATRDFIKDFKGAKTDESVEAYLHQSIAQNKRIIKTIKI